jgi:hypothetical protein
MIKPDLYTITQALGKYYGHDAYYRDELPPLHNLLYTSKSTRQGSLDRYKKEECTMSIKQNEFKNYLVSKPNHKVGVFIMKNEWRDIINTASIIILSHIGDDNYFVEWKEIYTIIFDNEVYEVQIRNTPEFGFGDFLKETMHLDDLMNNLFITRSIEGTVIDIYDHPDYHIRFDFLTTYNILTNRSSCVKLIKQYAKDTVLGMIDADIRKLVVDDKIPALNLYLYMNARILDINKNYPRTNIVANRDIKDNLEEYLSETEYERYAILDIIVNQIRSFT